MHPFPKEKLKPYKPTNSPKYSHRFRSISTDFQKNFIIKRQIPSLSRRQLYRCDEAFRNEISAYNHVIPLLKQYSGSNSPFPKCFFAGEDTDGEIIILDDLKQLGFKMKNRLENMDVEHCRVVMKVSQTLFYNFLRIYMIIVIESFAFFSIAKKHFRSLRIESE